LHENEILHKDYSPGNILIKKDRDKYIFKVVDINRMDFGKLSIDERLKNFNKLWAKDKYLIVIIKEYAKLSGVDEKYCLDMALKFNQKNKDSKNLKKRLKGQKVVD
jgi:serine/threonine protein kinase